VLLLQSFGAEQIGHSRSFGIAPAPLAECLFADMSSGFRAKVFKGRIMPIVQLWIAAIQLRWHDRLYKFIGWLVGVTWFLLFVLGFPNMFTYYRLR